MIAAVRRLPLQEVVPVAGLLAVGVLALGARPLLLGVLWLALVTPRLVAIDLAEHRLPDAIVLPGYPVVLAAVLLESWGSGTAPLDAVLAGAGCGAVILLLHTAGGMGFGDVKLAPILGTLTGALLPGGAILWLVLAFLLGGVAAVGVLIRRGRRARMAFGPPLLAGAWVLVALGSS